MDNAMIKALEFVEHSEKIERPDVLLNEFARVVSTFGFSHFIMTGLPSYGEDVEDLIVADRWPEGWRDHYREHSYFLTDPVSRSSFVRSTPFTWREARESEAVTPTTIAIEEEAKSFGLVDGIGFPLFDPTNWQAVVSLASDQVFEMSRREISMVYLASVYCQMRTVELSPVAQHHSIELSVREREVLTWLASGKSYWETSQILTISEATVQTHLRNIRIKLRATNTTQAVARAILSRQIHI